MGGSLTDSGRIWAIVLTQQSANPKVVAGNGESGAEKCGKERDETRKPAASTSSVDGIDCTTNLHRTFLVGIGMF